MVEPWRVGGDQHTKEVCPSGSPRDAATTAQNELDADGKELGQHPPAHPCTNRLLLTGLTASGGGPLAKLFAAKIQTARNSKTRRKPAWEADGSVQGAQAARRRGRCHEDGGFCWHGCSPLVLAGSGVPRLPGPPAGLIQGGLPRGPN